MSGNRTVGAAIVGAAIGSASAGGCLNSEEAAMEKRGLVEAADGEELSSDDDLGLETDNLDAGADDASLETSPSPEMGTIHLLLDHPHKTDEICLKPESVDDEVEACEIEVAENLMSISFQNPKGVAKRYTLESLLEGKKVHIEIQPNSFDEVGFPLDFDEGGSFLPREEGEAVPRP